MKSHSLIGTAIVDGLVGGLLLQRHAHIALLRNIVRHHHESFNGSGYPDGLAGEAIPKEAPIVTVADVYECILGQTASVSPRIPRVGHRGRG
jgi:HD-GYP domain-containing protein (c-di-GMP phosphodiesterase class II)